MAVSKTISDTGSHGHHKFTLVVTETGTSVANNTSTITIKFTISPVTKGYDWEDFNGAEKPYGTVTVNGTSYSWDLPDYNGSSTITLVSKTQTVTHNDNGAKSISLSFSCSSGSTSYLPGAASASGTLALTTIARASSFTASNGTLGTAQTISVTKKNSSYTHTITATCGGQMQTVCTKSSSTSVSWTPQASFAQANTTGTSVSVTLSLQTYSGNTAIGSAVTKTVSCSIPTSVKSTISSVTVTDSTGLANTFGSYIQGKSKVKAVIAVSNSNSQNATVSKAEMTVAGATYSSTATATSYTLTSSVIQSTGSQTVTSKITDTRGRTTTDTKSVNFIAYSEPYFNDEPTIGRYTVVDQQYVPDDTGDYCRIDYDVGFTSIKPSSTELNTTRVTITYQASDASSPTTLVNQSTTLSGTQYFQAYGDKSYLITITATDAVGSRTVWSSRLSTASVIMHFAASGTAMGIGKIEEHDETLDVGWDLRVKGVDILSELFFKPGDTLTIGYIPLAGQITSASLALRFGIPVAKSLALVNGVEVDQCIGGIRHNGGYINPSGYDTYDWLSAPNMSSLYGTKRGDYYIQLCMDLSSAFSGSPNNVPLNFYPSTLVLRFT